MNFDKRLKALERQKLDERPTLEQELSREALRRMTHGELKT